MRCLFILLAVFLASACTGAQEPLVEDQNQIPISQCVTACKQATSSLDNGPCLLDPIPNSVWVCDIAHMPRESIDNKPENQCQSFRNKTATHFIELTPECEMIRIV